MASTRVTLLNPAATVPTRGSPGAAGYDLTSVDDVVIAPGDRAVVHTGIAMCPPPGTYARVCPRSGIAVKFGIHVLAGVVDGDYRGEIMVVLLNTGRDPFPVRVGDRIAQIVFENVTLPTISVVDEIEPSERGDAGFGSTGGTI